MMMSDERLRSAAQVASLAAFCCTVTGLLAAAAAARSDSSLLGTVSIPDAVIGLGFPVLAGVILGREPRHRVALLILVAAIASGVLTLSSGIVALSLSGTEVPGLLWFAWLANWTWYPSFATAPVFLLVFPTGRARWRWAGWVLKAHLFFAVLVSLLLIVWPEVELTLDGPTYRSPMPLRVEALEGGLFGVMWPANSAVYALASLVGIASLVARLRSARGIEQLQVKWVIYAATLMGLVLPLTSFVELTSLLNPLAVALLVAAIGISMTRYRLYEIDRIVNRTIVYGLVTAGLAGVYAAAVLALRTLLPVTDESPLVVAGSTLAMVALFRPLRERIQGAVDRRFYRRRY
ncbi:MAG: hypothetical protein ACRDKZ_13670, partial [Actinomycetota bacterium]